MKVQIAWNEFKKNGEIVTKTKTVEQINLERFIDSISEKDSFYRILETRYM